MTTASDQAQSLIQSAVQALKTGNRNAANIYAKRASELAPETEQPWLILAFLSDSTQAKIYLERALQVNPSSARASAGLAWLKQQAIPPVPVPGSDISAPPAITTSPVKTAPPPKNRLLLWLLLPLLLLAGIIILVVATPQTDVPGGSLAGEIFAALSARPSPTMIVQPTTSATPIPVASATLANSPTTAASKTSTTAPTITRTNTPQSTVTRQPSPTRPKATQAVTSQYTVQPGDTLFTISVRFNVSITDLMAVNNIANASIIYVGQVLTIPGAGAVIPTVSHPAGTPGQGKEIQIDISEQRMYAYQDGKLVFKFVVSTGTGNSTRIGTFKVLDKIPKAYSSRFNIWMPWWMGIYYSGTLENGIHGLPLLMNGVELWGSLLGQPATYGCIESKSSEAKLLYDWAEIGTPVIIRR